MITLFTIIIIATIISIYRIHVKSKARDMSWNPFNGNVAEYLFTIIGTAFCICLFTYLIFKYLS
jgi:hypothetical protein